MTYAPAKFEVTTSNGLEDTITRNVTYKRTDGHRTYRRITDRLWCLINIPYNSKDSAGIIKSEWCIVYIEISQVTKIYCIS